MKIVEGSSPAIAWGPNRLRVDATEVERLLTRVDDQIPATRSSNERRAVAAQCPPLTAAQRDRLATILRGHKPWRQQTEAEFHLVTFEEIEASLQLREFEYRRPTRAKRLITKCPDCGADLIDNPSWLRLAQLRQRVPAGSILDALKITGALTVPKSPADLGVKHGNQVRIMYRFADEFAGKLSHVKALAGLLHGPALEKDRGDKRVTEYVLQTEEGVG